MTTRFDDWEGEYLEHHGIPGMKWGVRCFQNKDGTLTAAGQKRYGPLGRGASASKMTEHLNALDKGYANVEARRRSDAYSASRHALKANKALAKGKTEKAKKEFAKARKFGERAGQANRNKKAIENLQWRIIAKAVQKGYTTSSEPVKRKGEDGRLTIATIFGRGQSVVDGQQFKVSRKGDRSTNVVNYNAAKSENVRRILQEERDKERARQYGNVRR